MARTFSFLVILSVVFFFHSNGSGAYHLDAKYLDGMETVWTEITGTTSDYGKCPTFFVNLSNRCYFFSELFRIELTWQEARNFCKAYGLGYDLLQDDGDQSEFGRVVEFMRAKDYNASFFGLYEISQLAGEQWVSTSGRSFALEDPLWDCNFPLGKASERCGILIFESEYIVSGYIQRLRIQDENCFASTFYICEGPLIY